jgi:hypothetical protein
LSLNATDAGVQQASVEEEEDDSSNEDQEDPAEETDEAELEAGEDDIALGIPPSG